MQTPDTDPLADALTKISAITEQSESDPELMLGMLNQILEAAEAGKAAYREQAA